MVLVVDAIDESNQRGCMISDLKMFSLECPFVKVLVSSREEFDITKAFKSFRQVKISQSGVVGDIKSLMKAEIAAQIRNEDLIIRRPEVQKTVCNKLVNKSEGMFQLVKCQIQILCGLGTDKAILKALEQLPKDFAGTYTRIL